MSRRTTSSAWWIPNFIHRPLSSLSAKAMNSHPLLRVLGMSLNVLDDGFHTFWAPFTDENKTFHVHRLFQCTGRNLVGMKRLEMFSESGKCPRDSSHLRLIFAKCFITLQEAGHVIWHQLCLRHHETLVIEPFEWKCFVSDQNNRWINFDSAVSSTFSRAFVVCCSLSCY